MSQSIRVDQLKLGSRLAADVFETTSDGLEVLLYARDQVISSDWQLSRLLESGTAVVPISPDSMREPLAELGDPEGRRELLRLRAGVDAARPAEAAIQRDLLAFFEQAQQQDRPDLEAVEGSARELARQGREDPELLDILNLLREAAPVAFRHSQNVASLALRVSLFRKPEAEDEELRRVVLAGLLHDVGMMHCVSLMQFNQGELDETAEIYRDHPDFGVEIVKGLTGVPGEVRRAVAEHHERINGNGFPQALNGAELHPLAELVGLCDTYERLTHGISYRRALSPVAALNLIQGWARREFHEELIMDFTRALGPWPLGAPVELESGLRGRVTSRRNPFSPLVACKTEQGLQVLDSGEKGLAVRRGVTPALAELHPTEIF